MKCTVGTVTRGSQVHYILTFTADDGAEKKFEFDTKPPPLEVIKFFHNCGMKVPPSLGGDEAAKEAEAKAAAEVAAKRQLAAAKSGQSPEPMYVVHGDGPHFKVVGGRGFSGTQQYTTIKQQCLAKKCLFEDPEVRTLTYLHIVCCYKSLHYQSPSLHIDPSFLPILRAWANLTQATKRTSTFLKSNGSGPKYVHINECRKWTVLFFKEKHILTWFIQLCLESLIMIE